MIKRACDLSPEDRADIIRQLDFGAGMSETLLARLGANSTAIDYRRRRLIYRVGEPADGGERARSRHRYSPHGLALRRIGAL